MDDTFKPHVAYLHIFYSKYPQQPSEWRHPLLHFYTTTNYNCNNKHSCEINTSQFHSTNSQEKKINCSFLCYNVIIWFHLYNRPLPLVFLVAAGRRDKGLTMKYSRAPHLSCILLFPFFTSQSRMPGPSFFTWLLFLSLEGPFALA